MNNGLNFRQLEETKAQILLSRAAWKSSITVCGGTGCHAQGGTKIVQAFREEIKNQVLDGSVELRTTGCHGFLSLIHI